MIPNVPYAKFGELIGMKGIYCDDPESVGAAWDEALAAERPVVIEFKTDPKVPPLPPHITFANAMAFTKTLAKGDQREGRIIANSAHQLVGALMPGRKD